MNRPLIGITVDRPTDAAQRNIYTCGVAYARCVARAGGMPIMLPIEIELAAHYVGLCDGLILTGGVDPDVRIFGDELHPEARVCDPRRQAFEMALLRAIDKTKKPALGICFGMQLMALIHDGKLNQYMPDNIANPETHQNDARHPITLAASDSVLGNETCDITSWHQQCVEAPGALRVVATAPDGVIEAIDNPKKPFYLGVQWHPERGGDGPLNQGLIDTFVNAAGHGSKH